MEKEEIMEITSVRGSWVIDSRANPTVRASVSSLNNKASAIAPSGASTGKKEALELKDSAKASGVRMVNKAVDSINNLIAPALIGKNAEEQRGVDSELKSIDGTGNFSKIGGNSAVAVSMAVCKLGGKEKGIETYEHIRELFRTKPSLPSPMFNMINGGKHAGNDLAIQEFLVVVEGRTFSESLIGGVEIYHVLKKNIEEKYGRHSTSVGDEGGFSPNMKETREALGVLSRSIEEAGYSDIARISMDAAADSFYSKGKYLIDGMSLEAEELLDYYLELCEEYGILSIEDPFEEMQADMYGALKKRNRAKVIGDDLTVTNKRYIEQYKDSIDGVIIKPNQVGTVSEAAEAVIAAKEEAPFIIGSHRSGDSEDDFIADFSCGMGLPYVKFGAPARGERTCKYNKLLQLEEIV